MCNPQAAMVAMQIASAGLQITQYKADKQNQENVYKAQKRQNEIAKANAIQRYAAEQLKIRQELQKSARADYIATLKARKVRSQFITEAGSAGLAISGSTELLMRDYYRTEGNYRNALVNNMNVNISQFERNLEAIQFGEQSQLTYETPPNPGLLFATHALNMADTYYSLENQKAKAGLMTRAEKRRNKRMAKRYRGYT
ncbi:hypothetical protein [uncultured phage_Deep-GF0-KM16-C193]|uniref:Uncharacterized protein n=1 Tax=uncultured phage_Deep-GF0-KM16-C193 TaxID=2740799 RepID=A0A1B1IWM7_9CAUD|nr:hypothetical protein HOU06_gp01 [uncultured phage_Deep-GF0-KM16-C193]ANS05735.1 hypothetical protein [uncultured phage_Deep-GF0-KM16-C193]